MPIRADNDPRFFRRFLIMGIVAIGFALWSLYDGIVKYPAQRARGFDDFKVDYRLLFPDPQSKAMSFEEFTRAASDEQRTEWKKYSQEREIKNTPEIVTQYIQATIAGIAGLFLLSLPLRARGRWIEMDESGMRSSWGQSFQFDQVESLNKRRWRDKGIAKVYYRDENRKRKFVIDDYKFLREPTDAILFELEQRIGIDKITGGPPEPIAEVADPEDPALQSTVDEAS